jgi:hypothetical protein
MIILGRSEYRNAVASGQRYALLRQRMLRNVDPTLPRCGTDIDMQSAYGPDAHI